MEPATAHLAPPIVPGAGPATLCDLVLGAAIAADADVVWIEPAREGAAGRYTVDIERHGRVIASGTLDNGMGAAVIARLAFITNVDLLSGSTATGAARVRGPDASASITSTIRPGRQLRAEVHVRKHAPRATRSGPAAVGPGTQIAQYLVRNTLGSGGMGRVYEAEHTALGRTFALKVLHARMLNDDGAAQFLREARAAARIKHPHIVDVVDFGYLDDGRPYLVMELLAGRCVAQLLDEALPVWRAVSIARQIATGLAAAHAVGVVHADVTASNVFVTDDGHAKLVDFGLALVRDDPRRREGTEPADHVFGTPSYISPEQIRGNPATERSDQYSLGIVLFEMITGAPPFAADSTRDLCLQHLQAAVPEVTSPHGPAPRAVADIIRRCLAKNPAQRFGSTAELVQALTAAEQAIGATGWERWLTP